MDRATTRRRFEGLHYRAAEAARSPATADPPAPPTGGSHRPTTYTVHGATSYTDLSPSSPPSPAPRPPTIAIRADSPLLKSIRVAMVGTLIATVAFGLADGQPLWDQDIPLWAMVAAILASLYYSHADRRRAEALGLAAAAAFLYWYTSRFSWSPRGLGVGFPEALHTTGHAVSALSAPVWSALSFRERRSDPPPTPLEVGELQRADRATLRQLAWATLTAVVPAGVGLVLLLTSLGQDMPYQHFRLLLRASTWDMLVAIAVNGIWITPLSAGLVLLVRGRWSRRTVGSTWAISLLLATALAWPTISSIVEDRIAEATRQTRNTRVPSAVIPGGRFCGRVWTQTLFPTRTFIAGDQCDTLYQYSGWYRSWSADLSEFRTIDELLSIDGTYIVMADRSSIAVAFDSRGREQWRFRCEGGIEFDESQLDAGDETPDNQTFSGTCHGTGPFRLDPATGGHAAYRGRGSTTTTTATTATTNTTVIRATTPTTAAPTVPPNPGNTVDCADFDNHAAAQEWFDTYWPHYGDVALIDINNNGVACESLLTDTEKATTTTRSG